MATPTGQTSKQFIVPPGEAQRQYAPNALATKVENFVITPEGTLRSVVGPCLYEPTTYSGGKEYSTPASELGRAHGIFQASLVGGIADTLIIRAGTALYRHEGWQRSWVSIETGLSSEHLPKYPDQFVVLADKIIWTNGTDQARVISHDGMVVPLGFAEVPGAPSVFGPDSPNGAERSEQYPNMMGYAWPGRIGTAGDTLDGDAGPVLMGGWYYHVQYQDIHGNLSATSAMSNVVTVDTMNAAADNTGYISDLTRQFLVSTTGTPPEHAVAVWLYRTPDILHDVPEPRFLARVPGSSAFSFSDEKSDGELGAPSPPTVAVPVFRVMCTHQGRLVVANFANNPGLLRRSRPGLPGTFNANDWVIPDSGGAEITGAASHDGALLVFTASSVYSLEDFGLPRPLAQGIGCIAPGSIKALPDGRLIWLGRDGFYAMHRGVISLVSGLIHSTIRRLNRARLSAAVAVVDPVRQEYRCAVAEAGKAANTLLLCFNGSSWRRQRLGLKIAGMCRTDDWRQLLLGIAHYKTAAADFAPLSETKRTIDDNDATDVFVFDHETSAFDVPDRNAKYQSAWMYGDEIGLTPLHVRSMYIGLLDAYNDDFEISFYRNGSWKEVVTMTDIRAVGPDDGSNVVIDIAGSAVIGTSKVHDPRLFWRQVPVGIENAYSWAFRIKASYPIRLHIAAFAFDISTATLGNVRGRIPQRADI